MSEAAAAADQPAAPTDAAWAASARARLADVDAALAARFDRNEDVDVLVHARAQAVDGLIREAWARCIPDGAPLALFAVGGYGRGELFPQSDIDLLVLADGQAQRAGLEQRGQHGDVVRGGLRAFLQ